MGLQIMKMLPRFFLAALLMPCVLAADTEQRIYTAPDPAATGGIKGTVDVVVTHALAVDHDQVRGLSRRDERRREDVLFRAPAGRQIRPRAGDEDNAKVYEGLALGEEKRDLPAGSMDNLKTRITKQDAFFNRVLIHRLGFDGENTFAFVERIRRPEDSDAGRRDAQRHAAAVRRDRTRPGGRRLAGDDHAHPLPRGTTSRTASIIPCTVTAKELGNLRVIDGVKDLGSILPLSSLQ